MICSSREGAARLLAEHDFPPFFRDVAFHQYRRHGDDLKIYFESTREFYRLLAEAPEDIPFADSIIPLHESNCDFLVCYAPPPHDIYIEHSIEWRPEDRRVIAQTRESYLEYELQRLWFAEFEIEAMRLCVALFSYSRIDEFLDKAKRDAQQ